MERKTYICYTQKRAGKSILLDHFPLFQTILYDRSIPIQTLINITLLRSVMLTAPFGAWATCAQIGVCE